MSIAHFPVNKITRLIPIVVIGTFFSSPTIAFTSQSGWDVIQPIVFKTDVSNVHSISWLIKQLTYTQLLHRPDITKTTLDRLFAIDPNNVEGLGVQAQYLAGLGQVDQAMVILKKLEISQPYSKITKQLKSALSVFGEKKTAYQQIILLSRSGRNEEALQALTLLFPNGMPTPELQLIYLDIASGVKGNEKKVLNGLVKLNQDHPGVPDFQLAYAEYISKDQPSNPIAMRIFQRLSLEPSMSVSAASLWLSRLNSSYITKDVVQQYGILASYFPSNMTYRKALLDASNRFDKEQQLRKDTRYIAKLDGLKNIKAGHIRRGQQQLLIALKARPNDHEILGGLGTIYLKLGQQEIALSYFKKAKRNDKDLRNTDKWNSLIYTSSYWSLLDRGERMMERGDLYGANKKYNQAIKYSPGEPYAYNYLAKVALLKKNEKRALRYYNIALSKNRLDETALRGWFNLQVTFYGKQKALNKGLKLSFDAQRVLAKRFNEIEISLLMTKLTRIINNGKITEANMILERLLSAPPESPWLRSEIADSLRLMGKTERANTLMQIWSKEVSAEMSFAYALYLARYGETAEAIAQLVGIPERDRSDAMVSNLNRLEKNQAFETLAILVKNDSVAAIKNIDRLKVKYVSNIDLMLLLIDFQFQLGLIDQAKAELQQITPIRKWSIETQLRYGQLLFKLEENKKLTTWQAFLTKTYANTEFLRDQKIRRDVLFAEYAFRNKNYQQAEKFYLSVGQLKNQYNVLFGLIKTQQALGKDKKVQQWALHLFKKKKDLSSRQSIDLAIILAEYGYKSESIILVNDLKQKQATNAIDYRDGMAIAMKEKQWTLANNMADYALIEDAINPQNDVGVVSFSGNKKTNIMLTPNESLRKETLRDRYNNANDNWLTRNVKSDLDRMHKRHQGHISFGIDYSGRESQNKVVQVPIEAIIPMPEYDGYLQFRSDIVHIDSGDINYYSTTTDINDQVTMNDKATGTVLSIGWLANTWNVDIGTTPIGFDQQYIVGGVNLSGDFGNVGWRATLSRRAETSSMLSYAGMTVPDKVAHQGDEWGGVIKTGINLGGSYDLGGSVGYWTSVQWHKMTGDGVEDNIRLGLLGGTYWKIINEEYRRLSLGLNLMYLNYDKNLSEYIYGNGGYYSPKQYFSTSMPVNYYARLNDKFSYLVSGAVSHSWTAEDEPYGYGSSSGSTQGGGFSFSLQAAAEQRISKRWYLGAAFDIQRSDFYEPNHLLFYAKYTFTDRWQPIAMPVNTLTLYGDFD